MEDLNNEQQKDYEIPSGPEEMATMQAHFPHYSLLFIVNILIMKMSNTFVCSFGGWLKLPLQLYSPPILLP